MCIATYNWPVRSRELVYSLDLRMGSYVAVYVYKYCTSQYHCPYAAVVATWHVRPIRIREHKIIPEKVVPDLRATWLMKI